MPSKPPPAILPAREAARLAELRSYEILDTPPDPIFDGLANLTAQMCGTPIALIVFVDETRLWFKARTGIEKTGRQREHSLCTRAIRGDDLYVVRDMHRHAEMRHAPEVTGPPHLRFYAAFPLRMPSGHTLGTLCVIDQRPRQLNAKQRAALRAIGGQVVAQLELKRTVADLRRAAAARDRAVSALRESEERFQHFMNHGPAVAYIKDEEGRFVYVNEPLAQRFEIPAAEWLGKTDADILGKADADAVVEHDLQVLAENRPLTIEEVVPTPDGLTRYWLSYKFPLSNGDRKQVGGLSFDITARKQAEHERERLVNDLRDALAQVKTLAGFLPICASCKNIRRDEGSWQQIEAYLSEHSELEFTHGICPACVEKLYPEFAAFQRGQFNVPPPPPEE